MQNIRMIHCTTILKISRTSIPDKKKKRRRRRRKNKKRKKKKKR
jgi:hypothetical protein